MPNKYIAKLDGKIVGKRTSASRTYTHCVVGRYDEAAARKAAYEYAATESDKSNFKYYGDIAACEGNIIEPDKFYGQPIVGQFLSERVVLSYTAAAIADAKAKVGNGFDGYIALLRAEAIERFESGLAKGAYKPKALAWAGRLDLAQKEGSSRAKYCAQIWIVPAEKVEAGK